VALGCQGWVGEIQGPTFLSKNVGLPSWHMNLEGFDSHDLEGMSVGLGTSQIK